MKKVLKLLAFTVILYIISFGTIKSVDAQYICNNDTNDTCQKKIYKYDKDGNIKNYEVTIGVYHFKQITQQNPNEQYIKAFDNCSYNSKEEYCKGRKGFKTEESLSISVESATNMFPKAICANPGEVVTSQNFAKWIYFTDAEIAASSCNSSDIYYTEDSIVKKDNRVCEKLLESYTISSGVTSHQISTNFYQAGPQKICSVSVTYNNDQTVNYNHYDSTVSCNSSNYKFVCQDIGDPTKSGDQCYLYSCNETNNSNGAGFTCKLRNESNYNDYIEISYVNNEHVKNPSAMNTQFDSRYYISKNGAFVKDNMKNYLTSHTESCPNYIYYDTNAQTYLIFSDMLHFNEYEKNNKNHTYIKYSFVNANDRNILNADNITDEGIPNYWENIPERPKYTGERHCGIFGDTTWDIINTLYGIVKVLIPVLVVILGMIDFASVVFSGEDKDMKTAGQRFIKRIIVGVVLLLLPAILGFIFNLVGFSEGCLADLM